MKRGLAVLLSALAISASRTPGGVPGVVCVLRMCTPSRSLFSSVTASFVCTNAYSDRSVLSSATFAESFALVMLLDCVPESRAAISAATEST